MPMNFTPQQQRVIDTRNCNILVSAAAGSGKTAVLVERIIRMITEENAEERVDIDRLLIVTFTQAAAAQMRERISEAIEQRLAGQGESGQPENEHLQRQATLLHNAQITTIDSFCLFVLRNNFNDIGLDPGFRVANEGEVKLLKRDVLTALLEDYFEAQDEIFHRLVESFSPSGSEKPLAEQLLKIYEFAMSFPWPEEWLEGCAAQTYDLVEDLEKSPWMQEILQDCKTILKDHKNMIKRAKMICLEPDGPYMYEAVLEDDAIRIDEVLSVLEQKDGEKLQAVYQAMSNIAFARLPSKKDDSVSVQKREQIKSIRQSIKESVLQVRERFFYQEPKEQLANLQGCEEMVKKLIELTLAFRERFQEAKRDKNIIDFQDMEHMALQILVHRQDGRNEPTAAAVEYRNYFAEVMIDEYQDSNLVQEALLGSISGEAEGRYNRFMVGDVKQSIYKFRLARPELFLEKYHTYSTEGGNCQRIDLHKNFRSRNEVIDCVNLVFSKIMGHQLGKVEYDDQAALYPGASYEEGSDAVTELMLYDREGDKSGNVKEQEARMVAGRIKELVGHFLVTDKESGLLRPAAYRDIVILLRSNQGWDDVFTSVLREEGIPVYAASKTGYFSTPEIQTLLHFLRIIDNPMQDIALFCVLKSGIGGFTDEELAAMKGAYPEQACATEKQACFYEMFTAYQGEPSLCEKRDRFMDLLNTYRDRVHDTTIARLLRMILTETGYGYLIGALPGGEQRQANVEMLLAKAADFEQTSYYGLFHFIRYMEQMEKYEIDYGEANIQEENADTIRIMSIHKSKGLEFPICFVSGLNKRFNRMDVNRPLLMDVDYGIGAEYVDVALRLRQSTLKKNAVSRKLLLEAQGEELRVLYVALTRAKEKLIMTGAVTDLETSSQQALLWRTAADGRLPFTMLAEASGYLDWILPAVLKEEAVRLKRYTQESLIGAAVREEAKSEQNRLRLQAAVTAGVKTVLADSLQERFSFQYQHQDLENLYTKTTVSELKKSGMQGDGEAAELFQEEEVIPYVPRFMEKKEAVSATARGSAYHRVMELLDFAKMPFITKAQDKAVLEAWLLAQMEQQEAAGRLSQSYKESVNVKKAAGFLRSDLAERMRTAEQAGVLYREQAFVLGIPANRLQPQFPSDEIVLVQGIIDVYFEEEDYLVVADYKTDRVARAEELCQRYQVQLDYYAEALCRLTGKPVREKIIYSFALGTQISLP